MAITQAGTAHVVGLNFSGSFVITLAVSSWPGSNLQNGGLTHNVDSERIKGVTGDLTGVIMTGPTLECEFNLIPEASTKANAIISASLPDAPSDVSITGMHIVAAGPFVNAFNTNGAGISANKWGYIGGGRIQFSNSEKWMMVLPLIRCESIASWVAVS